MHRIRHGIFNSEDKKIPKEKNDAAFFPTRDFSTDVLMMQQTQFFADNHFNYRRRSQNAPSSNTLIKIREGYVPIGYR
jgi:hypothetical protein